jgi:hypothetical protein
LILGIVISTPLTLQIFHKEIDAQLAIDHQEAEDAFKRQLADDTELRRIPALQQKVSHEEKLIDDGGNVDASKDPRVTAAQSAVDAKQKIYDREAATYL